MPVLSLPSEKVPGAPFAELDVRSGVQYACGAKSLHVPLPGVHVSAPLQQQGAQPRPRQGQGGEQARRPLPTTTGRGSAARGNREGA